MTLDILNVPKACEYAIAEALRKNAELGKGVALRTWQNLESDGSWDKKKDLTFPLVDIRATMPVPNEDQQTMECNTQVLCGTLTDEDRNHQTIGPLNAAVYGVLFELFAQFMASEDGTYGTELTAYLAVLTRELGTTYHFGGLSFGEPVLPYDDGGHNMIGVNFILNFARDYS